MDAQDEGIIVAILEAAGSLDNTHFRSQAYGSPTIDRGLFTIPYFWMDKDSPIEDAAMVAQACGGRFFLTQKMVCIITRTLLNLQQELVALLKLRLMNLIQNLSLIMQAIKNFSRVLLFTARPRYITEVKVWRSDDVVRLAPGEVKIVNAKLNQPLIRYSNINYIATTTAGLPISGITSSVASYSQRLIITLTNSSAYTVFIRDFMQTEGL